MYIVYDNEMNEIEITETLEKAEKIYESFKQNYFDDGWLPEEGTAPVTISRIIKHAEVVESDIDDEGEQLYTFEDVERGEG